MPLNIYCYTKKIAYLLIALLSSQPLIAQTSLGSGAIVTADSIASEVGENVLTQGGNAIDAAVATALVLAVTYPEAGNIGGGGFMTVFAEGKPYFLDYREKAPQLTSRDFYKQFKNEAGEQDPNSSLWGAQAVGVPGTVAGLWEAHKKFGKLPWSDLVAPAMKLASDGYYPSHEAIEWRNFMMGIFGSLPYPNNLLEYYGSMNVDEHFKQPELAKTLAIIAQDGRDGFYKGKIADLLVASMSQDGGKGVITNKDLLDYEPVWRNPISFKWKGMDVITAPPPSSGGVALAQLLGMKELLDHTAFKGVEQNSAQYMHLNAEMMKQVFADRAVYLGDPDFVDVPVSGLLSESYIKERASKVNSSSITPFANAVPGKVKMHTTHFSIVDKWGNAVSNTYTLNMPYGSGVVVRGAGFVLNDEMDDFATVPGQPNYLGVIGGGANEIQPGKRPLSSMTPTIILKDGEVKTVIGTPGGSRIFTSIYQVLANIFDYKMSPNAAVNTARFHHQLPQWNIIEGEPKYPIEGELADHLKAKGYEITTWAFHTDIQMIDINDNKPIPVSDSRGRGLALVEGSN